MRIVLAMAVVLAGAFAHAGAGTSKLQMSGMWAGGYDLVMEGDTITGYIDGFGSMSGKVNLVKKDGKWSGKLGMMQIKAGALVQTAEPADAAKPADAAAPAAAAPAAPAAKPEEKKK